MAPARRPTILLVDDDPTVLQTYARMLRLEGYDVHTALDAEGGLEQAATCAPDAIFLDLRMPLADGLAFLQRLRAREDERQTPVAIVTGDYLIDDAMTDTLRGLGATIHFKPLWLDDLVELTHKLVRD
jgi:CheY-like chemotaxis protein